MTVATPLLTLALKNAGVNGIGQTPSSDDLADSLVLLNDTIGQWNADRTVLQIPGTLALFPDLVTDVPSWTGNENVLLTTMAARLRTAYGLAPDEFITMLATNAIKVLQANNQQFQPPVNGGVPTTCLQLIYMALRICNRITDQQGVAASSADVDVAFAMLQMMVAQWQVKRWLVIDEVEQVITSTGATSYSVGPPRQNRVLSAFCRMLSSGGALPVDYTLYIINSREEYNAITLKTWSTIPTSVFFDTSWPTGLLYFWPIPPAGVYELHVTFKASMPTYATVGDALGLPPEYTMALAYGLALQMPQGKCDPSVQGLYRAALGTVRAANLQIAPLVMPAGVAGRPRGGVSMVGPGLSRAFTLDGGSVLT